MHIFSFIYFARAAKIRDVDGAWSGKNKSGETISKQPGSNRPGANFPDASNSGKRRIILSHYCRQPTAAGPEISAVVVGHCGLAFSIFYLYLN